MTHIIIGFKIYILGNFVKLNLAENPIKLLGKLGNWFFCHLVVNVNTINGRLRLEQQHRIGCLCKNGRGNCV
ncbi:MAG: hypothetical protein A2167_06905 [Planctomycetes bacterium RBG_13_46_10]|nr:MAG: hypothetical protein A2167_06905 [Planctomycetes bacterium RBG_13_46_10]